MNAPRSGVARGSEAAGVGGKVLVGRLLGYTDAGCSGQETRIHFPRSRWCELQIPGAKTILYRCPEASSKYSPGVESTPRSIRVEFEKFSLASFFAQQGWQIWTGNTHVVFLRERVSVTWK